MKNNLYVNLFVVILGLYLLYIAFYLMDKAAFSGKHFKRLPKPYFEGYVIKSYDYVNSDGFGMYWFNGYFNRMEDGMPVFMAHYPRRFFTKFGAKHFIRKNCIEMIHCIAVRERWFA